MDCSRVGSLMHALRKEKKMTQKQLANLINISEKAISKWERGLSCPDVSLLADLSEILGVNIEKILAKNLHPNDADRGNMKSINFYVCPECSSVLTSTGQSEISCCGKKLETLIPQLAEAKHKLLVEKIEDDFFITVSHDMERSHFIRFVAFISSDRVLIVKLYPEQGAEVRFPKMYSGKLYFYCIPHGLWVNG